VALAEAPVREQALADELVAAHRELADERVTIARLTDASSTSAKAARPWHTAPWKRKRGSSTAP